MNSIVEIWEQLAVKYDSRIALKDETTGYSLSFNELNEKINKVTQILESLNLENNSNILLCLTSQPLWHVIDQAIMKSNFVSVLCDSVSSISEIEYFIETMQIKVLFTDNTKLIENLRKENKSIYIFYVGLSYNNNNICNLIEEINKTKYKPNKKYKHLSNTIASIMFSSGTTGKSKGAMFTHENLLLCFYDYKKIYSIYEQSCVNILSLAHVAPRINEWALLSAGNTIIYTNYNKYLKTIKKYKPYYLMCVPKLLNMLIEEYKKECLKTSILFQVLNNIAFAISYRYYKLKFKYINNILIKFISIFNFICYKYFIKNIINLFVNPTSSIIAFGAFTGEDIEGIISTMGLNLMVQYGMTEASVISYTSHEYKKAYSVGRINENMDVVICDIKNGKKLKYNEIGIIKVKGKQIMKGYYNNEKETKENFDDNGYFITGDLGYITKDNYLFFSGRYKNIIVLNNGENIDSVKIEEICNKSNFIKQIVVFGQDKPYLTAIAVLKQDYILQWLKNKNIDINTQTGKNLLKKDILIDINNLIGNNKFFRWIEQVKDICFINEPFTIENGLLTRKYTIIRSKVYAKYKNLIDDMYNQV